MSLLWYTSARHTSPKRLSGLIWLSLRSPHPLQSAPKHFTILPHIQDIQKPYVGPSAKQSTCLTKSSCWSSPAEKEEAEARGQTFLSNHCTQRNTLVYAVLQLWRMLLFFVLLNNQVMFVTTKLLGQMLLPVYVIVQVTLRNKAKTACMWLVLRDKNIWSRGWEFSCRSTEFSTPHLQVGELLLLMGNGLLHQDTLNALLHGIFLCLKKSQCERE